MGNASETKEIQKTTANEKHNAFGAVLGFCLLAVGIGGGIYLGRTYLPTEKDNERLTALEQNFNALTKRIDSFEQRSANAVSARDLQTLAQRIDSALKLNQETLKTKAGQDIVLSLTAKTDALENKINGLGKVTSDNALILTAALMVKDAAAGGQPFEYEAAVLNQLAADTPYAATTAKIADGAATGLPCRKTLIAEFNKLYDAAHSNTEQTAETQPSADTPEAKDWKDKINLKLSKLITIKYHNSDGELVEKDIPEDEVYALVNDGKLTAAVDKMQDNPVYRTEAFQKWQQLVQNRAQFNQEMKHLIATALAALKVEHLRTVTE